jgi:hypothetical protein
MPFQLLKAPHGAVPRLDDRPAVDDDEALHGIRCPHCEWRPSVTSEWCCWWEPDAPEARFDSCGTEWNTFATNGRCPGCHHQWRWTSCLRCDAWSLHDDWYVEKRLRH